MRAYKFRMYPNKEQEILINKTFGCTRYIYNYFLDQKQKEYKEFGKTKTAFECCNEIKILSIEKEWLKEVDSCALRCSIFDLDDAYTKFFKKIGNYPKFKKKFGKNSYRTNNMTSTYKNNNYESIQINFKNKTIKLPKLKEVMIRGYRNLSYLNGRIINATISKGASGRYYVSVVVEPKYNSITIKKENSIVGIDLGINDLVTTSEGEVYKNPKAFSKYELRLKRMQRSLRRKEKGSNNYKKCKEKIGTIYRKIRNTRIYNLHEISKKITDNYKIIAVETLKIKKMMQKSKEKEISTKKRIAKSIGDCSWYELLRQIEYKSKSKGNKYYQIESNYASSQICSICEYKNEEIKNLAIRSWECPKCKNYHERDINASVNIMFKGLNRYIEECFG